MTPEQQAARGEVIDYIQGMLNIWHKNGVRWERTYWASGVLGIVGSAVATVKGLGGDFAPVFPLIATICYGFIGFANPMKVSEKFMSAYRMLKPALALFKEGNISSVQLINISAAADNGLGSNDPKVGQPATTPPAVPPAKETL